MPEAAAEPSVRGGRLRTLDPPAGRRCSSCR